MAVTTKIKQQLKAKAHHLKPLILMGHLGLTKPVHAEIERALTNHELIKIRLPTQEKAEKKALVSDISKEHNAVIIQLVGNIGTFYRKREEA